MLGWTFWLYVTEIQPRVNLLTHITEESGIFLPPAVLDSVSLMSLGIFPFFLTAMLFSKYRFCYRLSTFMIANWLPEALALKTATWRTQEAKAINWSLMLRVSSSGNYWTKQCDQAWITDHLVYVQEDSQLHRILMLWEKG